MKRLLNCFPILFIAVSCLFGCSCKKESNLVTYTNYYDSDVTTFNYLVTNEYHNVIQIANLVDGLVENDKYGNIIPSIAKSWTNRIENDKQIWNFKLKENVYWSDYKGNIYDTVKAQDFVTSIKYILNYNSNSNSYYLPASLLENGFNYYYGTLISNYNYDDIIANNDSNDYSLILDAFDYCNSNNCSSDFNDVGIKAINDFELQFTLSKPSPYFLSSLTYYSFLPASERFIKEVGFNNFGTNKKNLLYCGAYILTNYTHSNRMEYSKNENYWDLDNVFIDKLIYIKSVNYTNNSYVRKVYEAGNIDEFVLSSSDKEGWEKYVTGPNSKGSIDNLYGNNTYFNDRISDYTVYYFVFNQNRVNLSMSTLTNHENDIANKAMKNVNFRKALFYALDTSSYYESDPSIKTNSIIPESFVSLNSKDYYDYFIEEYASNNEMTFESAYLYFQNNNLYNKVLSNYYLDLALNELNLSSSDLPIKIEYTYFYYDDYSNYDKIRINNWNKTLNNCEIDTCDFNKVEIVFNDTVNTLGKYDNAFYNQEYNLSIVGLYPDYNDPSTYLNAFASKGEMSTFTNHSKQEYIDNLLNESYKYFDNTNLQERYKLYSKIENYILFEEALVLPICLKNYYKKVVVSNLVPYQKAIANYGLSPFKFKYRKIREKDYTQEEINLLKQEYEEGRKND